MSEIYMIVGGSTINKEEGKIETGNFNQIIYINFTVLINT